ncbi:MAG: cyclic pyranopterin monophosphate synthase MoaC [Chthoniobacteraceae bacterium]
MSSLKKSAKFSHLSASGELRMVNVGAKPDQQRRAVAEGRVRCSRETIALLKKQALPKGDVLAVARIAGFQGAKATSTLIPLCHPLPLHHVDLQFVIKADAVEIRAVTETHGKTGVEMEALTAVSIAALAIYDMCKAVDKGMVIEGIRVVEKTKR